MKLFALCFLAVALVAQDAPKPAEKAPASQPASQPAGRTPEQATVLKELLRSVDVPPVAAPEPIRSSEPSPTARKDESLQGEGTVIVDRPGRLIRSGERSEFKFASQEGKAFAQQLELLPNSWLEYIEKEAETGVSDFVITADVTSYRGRNFLLLRNFRRQVSHGNLSP